VRTDLPDCAKRMQISVQRLLTSTAGIKSGDPITFGLQLVTLYTKLSKTQSDAS
jgi:hypothetical protein